jgi:hypothetical protein
MSYTIPNVLDLSLIIQGVNARMWQLFRCYGTQYNVIQRNDTLRKMACKDTQHQSTTSINDTQRKRA